jgi:hypothetical protein
VQTVAANSLSDSSTAHFDSYLMDFNELYGLDYIVGKIMVETLWGVGWAMDWDLN